MGPLVLTDAGMSALIGNAVQAAAGAKGIFNGAFLGLIAAAFTPARQRVIGDVTEPTYTAYARQAVAWGAPDFLTSGAWGVIGSAVYTFRQAPGDPSSLIYGYFLASAATAGVLLAAALFDQPRALVDANSVVALVPELSLPSLNEWGLAAQLG